MTWGRKTVIELAEEYDACTKCPVLCESRTQPVFGSGSTSADLMIIGGAPGAEEDEYVEPFVGKAGRLFLDLLRLRWPETEELIEINEIPEGNDEEFFEALRDYFDQYIFWTNVICCMPADRRTPSAKEIKACRDRLHRTIYAVDPMLIVAAGKTAATALLGKKVSIVDKRGTIFDITITSPATGKSIRYPMLAVLDPGFLLHKGDQALLDKKKGHTHETAEDLGYGLELLDNQYQDLWGTGFPDRPEAYKT